MTSWKGLQILMVVSMSSFGQLHGKTILQQCSQNVTTGFCITPNYSESYYPFEPPKDWPVAVLVKMFINKIFRLVLAILPFYSQHFLSTSFYLPKERSGNTFVTQVYFLVLREFQCQRLEMSSNCHNKACFLKC